MDRIETGEIDTVVVAFTDMQGRLQGKRLHGRYFVDHVVGHGTEGCNYLLAVDVDMNTVAGYAISSWDKGYGDMEFVLDHDTIRLLTHLPATAMVQCDLVWPDGPQHSPVRPVAAHDPAGTSSTGSPSTAGPRWPAPSSSSSRSTRRTSRRTATDYRDLTPSTSTTSTTRSSAPPGSSRCCATSATTCTPPGLDVEGAKGECNFGQHEIGFLYAEALVTADNHAVYKTAAKEIAAQHGKAITFMAKYNEREGNSCHIHLSLRGTDGELVFWDDDAGRAHRRSTTSFVAGVLATTADFTLLYAPNINSYKRFADGSFAPTTIAWGLDNRTCAVRLVGRGRGRPDGEPGAGRRREPLPRAGRHARRRPARHRERAAARGRAGRQRLHVRAAQGALDDAAAREVFATSEVAREALGDEVVDHYVNMADVELAAYNAAVTDWELRRGFERL